MMNWMYTWLRRAFQCWLYFMGDVPVHVAFVMDGNRRYAERQHVDKATGHTHGYGKMVEVIHWCIELGVKHITVYAFSIDNFKRSPDEVSALMKLAEEKYIELARDNGLAEREGIRMHVVGDLELPPPAVQGAAARLMRGTAALRSQHATLNVCFSYTASEETVNAAHELQTAVRHGVLLPDDVTAAALHGALRTGASSPPVDLLIRTSGETRLSDFLLWQASHAHLCYLPTLWPDLSYLDFVRCILSYQRHAGALAGLRRAAEARLAAHEVPADRAGAQGAGPEGSIAGAGSIRVGGGSSTSRPAGTSAGGEETRRGGAGASESVRYGGAAAGSSQREDIGCERPSSTGCHSSDGVSSSGRGSGPEPGHSNGRLHGWLGRVRSVLPVGWFPGTTGHGSIEGTRMRRRGIEQGGTEGVPCGDTAVGDPAGGSGSNRDGADRMGREVRLLRFFEGLEQSRLAWIAAHADL